MVSETSSDQDSDRDWDRERMAYEQDLDDDAMSGFNIFALFVLDASIPSMVCHFHKAGIEASCVLTNMQTINKVIRDAFDDTQFDSLWLAEDYDSIDVHCGDNPGLHNRNGSFTAVNADWKSPWAGKDLQEVVEFVRNTPKPPKALNKVFFVILDKEQYDAHEWLTVCKIVEGEVQSLPCDASSVSAFLEGHDRDTWPHSLQEWHDRGLPAL